MTSLRDPNLDTLAPHATAHHGAITSPQVARLTREFQISILSTGGADENAKEAAKSRLEAALLRQLRKVRSFDGLALHASAHHSAASTLPHRYAASMSGASSRAPSRCATAGCGRRLDG